MSADHTGLHGSQFKDHFSGHADRYADRYAEHRSGYPQELFDFKVTWPLILRIGRK